MENTVLKIPCIRYKWLSNIVTPLQLLLKPSKLLRKGKALNPEIFSFKVLNETWTVLSGRDGVNFFAQLTLDQMDVFEFRSRMFTLNLPNAYPPHDMPNVTREINKILKHHFETVGEYEFTNCFVRSTKNYFNQYLTNAGTIPNIYHFIIGAMTRNIGSAFLGADVFNTIPKDLARVYVHIEKTLSLPAILFPFIPINHLQIRAQKTKLVKYFLQLIQKRRENKIPPVFPAIIDEYLKVQEQFALSDNHLTWLYNALYWSGIHYCSVHCFWIMTQIFSHPELLAELLKEQEKFDTIDWDSVKQMKLLQGTVRESLRLHPVYLIPRRVLKDLQFKDYVIPSGSVVAISPFLEHQNAEIFDNPHSFCPQRWTEPTKPSAYSSFIPGGAGHFGCLGMTFSIHCLTTFFSILLRSYQLQFVGKVPVLKESVILLPPSKSAAMRYRKIE